ncbi:MAG: FAD-dependent oxidoreductase, partial [Gemmatimonadetes bacterium]|nr:FAD-dependent oxidoreductase [Gemmatimonadota bacterium]
MPSVAIVGGGSTGLAAAYHLERSASLDRLALFETADRLGGVIRTEERDGFVLDVGPDSILAEPPAALELCRELGLEG